MIGRVLSSTCFVVDLFSFFDLFKLLSFDRAAYFSDLVTVMTEIASPA
jgi:hypothetical protein